MGFNHIGELRDAVREPMQTRDPLLADMTQCSYPPCRAAAAEWLAHGQESQWNQKWADGVHRLHGVEDPRPWPRAPVTWRAAAAQEAERESEYWARVRSIGEETAAASYAGALRHARAERLVAALQLPYRSALLEPAGRVLCAMAGGLRGAAP